MASFETQDVTRRRFLRWTQGVMAAVGVAPLLSKRAEAAGATAPAAAAGAKHAAVDYYAKLNVKKIINAKGTYTDLTAACMPAPVREAVYQAALHPVHLKDLQINAGKYIAEKLKCENALVSCGASSALTLATAACMQSANGCGPLDIPQEIGTSKFPKNEVIVQKTHRYGYDHAMFLCGAKIVEVETAEDFRKAIGPKTFMTNFLNSAAHTGQIQHEQWLQIAHEHGIPCTIDAAADMPPIENLWKYTGMGFDLVIFSGGKGIRGPQNAGLLLGKDKYIQLAHANNSPGDGVGRGMKVAKEQLVGMVAAVDYLLDRTDDGLFDEFKRREDVVWNMLKDVPTITSKTNVPEIANHVPELVLTYDPATVGIRAEDVQARLRELDMPIELGSVRNWDSHMPARAGRPQQPNPAVAAHLDTISLSLWMAQPGEEQIVGRELRKLLLPKSAAHAKAKA